MSVSYPRLKIHQASLDMSRDFYLDARFHHLLLAYRTLASDVASALGADRKVSVDDMNDMVDFEVSLANVCLNKSIT